MFKVITHNHGKFREIEKLVNQAEMLEMEYPEIQTNSLENVVDFALNYLASEIEGDFVIDDSGLFIPALNDFPGVYSAYVFETLGNEGILRLMEGKDERMAYFKTVIGLRYRGYNFKFIGICHGEIVREPRGSNGFGYDPIFKPEGYDKTFAEMNVEEKNAISHRGRALRKLRNFLERMGEI